LGLYFLGASPAGNREQSAFPIWRIGFPGNDPRFILTTYYLSCSCKPLANHANALRYTGMMADVMATVASIADAKNLVTGYLQNAGWSVDRIDHFETMSEAPIHDSRLNQLFQSARKKGLAATLSPYG